MNIDNLTKQLGNVKTNLSRLLGKIFDKQDEMQALLEQQVEAVSGELSGQVSGLCNTVSGLCEDISGHIQEIETAIYSMHEALSGQPLDQKNYLCFQALQDNVIVQHMFTSKNYTEQNRKTYSFQYSRNRLTWTPYSIGDNQSVPIILYRKGDRIWVRGDNATIADTDDSYSTKKYFKIKNKAKVSGNIFSLFAADLEHKPDIQHAMQQAEVDFDPQELKKDEGRYMFYLGDLAEIGDLDLGCLKSGHYMFHYCRQLEKISSINMPNITDAACMFSNCCKLTALPDGFSCPDIKNIGSIFFNTSLNKIGKNVKIGSNVSSLDIRYSTIFNNILNKNVRKNTDTSQSVSFRKNITQIGDGFEFFNNIQYNGAWTGIRGIFPNLESVPQHFNIFGKGPQDQPAS